MGFDAKAERAYKEEEEEEEEEDNDRHIDIESIGIND